MDSMPVNLDGINVVRCRIGNRIEEQAMHTYEKLRAEFKTWRHRYFDDERAAHDFVLQFVNGLRTYIGAPEFFTEPPEHAKNIPYVEVRKLVDKGDETFTLIKPDNAGHFLEREKDGYWPMGISISLEEAPNVWPKQSFGIPIHFIVQDSTCTMRITNRHEGEFKFDASSKENYTKAYDYIVLILMSILRANPSDQVREKQQFGFIIPKCPSRKFLNPVNHL